MILLLVFVACKKRDFLEPTKPQGNRLNLEALKEWHKANPITWHSLKSINQRSLDSLPFLPQWKRVNFYQKSNGNKVLLIPIYRELYVAYTDRYDFIRRLRVEMNADNEVLQASIIELMAERGSLASEESILIQQLENPQIHAFSGIIFEYNLQYQHISNKLWVNGIMALENLPIQYEEASNATGRSDCTPIYMSVWVPDTCPNVGLPGHTGHFCLNTGHYERILVGFDCNDSSLQSNNDPNGGAGGANNWTLPDNFGFLVGCCGSLGGDTGSNTGGGPRGHQISDPIEDARVLAQLNEITESYGVLQSDGTFQYAPTQKQKLELARTLDRLINQHPAYNNMYNLYKQKNIKVTWRIKADLGNGSTRGKAQIMVSPNGTRQNFISFSGTNSLRNNSTVAEEMIHILQLDKKGKLTGNYSVPDDQRVCIEFEAKAAIKMIAANGAGSKFDTDTFFDLKDQYKDTNPTRYNEIINFEKNTKDFFEKYKKMPLPKSRNEMNWVLFMNLLYDFNQYGPAGYNFPATYDADTWQWAIMFELFNF